MPERSSRRVLTSEWVDGQRWDDFLETADRDTKQRAAEVLFRFAQGSIQLHRVFNGDPHPGNYRFHPDGSVTFLDFGLLKRWGPGELEVLADVLDRMIEHDVEGTIRTGIAARFLPADLDQVLPHRDHQWVFDYVSSPYVPFMTDRFTFTRPWVTEALQRVMDVRGDHGELISRLNMPPGYVILDRVVWGISALLARLEADNNWRGILAEYRKGAPPATELGRLEQHWRAQRSAERVS